MFEGYLDTFRSIDLTFLQTFSQVLRGKVNANNLISFCNHLVRNPFSNLDSHCLFNRVVEGLQMLNIQCGNDVNPGSQDVLDVLISFIIAAAGDIGVGQLISQRHLWLPGQNRIHIHLFHNNPPVLLPATGNYLPPFEEPFGFNSAVGFHEAHDYIDPFFFESMTFEKHLVGLSDACCVAEIDLQMSALGAADHPEEGIGFVFNAVHSFPSRSRLSINTFTRGSPRIPRVRPSVWTSIFFITTSTVRFLAFATRLAWSSAFFTLM